MLDILRSLLDEIFPTEPSIAELRAVTTEDFRRHYHPHEFSRSIVLSDYRNPTIKAAITANKFHDYPPAAALLSTLLDGWLTPVLPQPTLLVPIPLGPKRYKERGYNQVTRILKCLKHPDVGVADLLIRKIETEPQTKLSRKHRLKNMRGVFAVSTDDNVAPNSRIIIVDDVITTGATLHEAKATLQEKLPIGTEILTLALAH
jgi:ComF family protein